MLIFNVISGIKIEVKYYSIKCSLACYATPAFVLLSRANCISIIL